MTYYKVFYHFALKMVLAWIAKDRQMHINLAVKKTKKLKTSTAWDHTNTVPCKHWHPTGDLH